jgi:putative MATE family efflux protein
MVDFAKQRDLTQGNVTKTLLLFALPALGGNILQSMNGTISSIYLGRLIGENALAASTVSQMISFLLFSSILIGQSMGRRDIAEVRRTVGAATGIFIIAGIAVSALGFIFTTEMLHVLKTPQAAFADGAIFLRLGFVGMPFVFLSVLLQSALRGTGDAMTPLYSTILNVVLSVLINPLFILGAGPIPAMGIAGAALAGVIANLACLIYLVARIYEKDLPLRLRGPEWRLIIPDFAHLKPILGIGLPMGASMIIMAGSQLVMMGPINEQGVDTVAAFGALNNLWSYVQMPAFAVGSAVSAMAAQNIGAGRWDRIGQIAKSGSGVNLLMTGVMVAGITLVDKQLLGLFLGSDSPAIPIARHIGHIVGWTFMLMGVSMVLISVMRANGAALVPLLMLINSTVVFRLGFGLGFYPTYGAEAIWWSSVVSAVVSILQTMAYYKWGKWRALKPRGASSGVPPFAEAG